MKNIKRTLALLLAMVMVLTMLPLAAVAEDQSPTPIQPEWDKEGAIHLDKKAQLKDASTGEYEITLTIEGKNYRTTSDVVLVIDNSNSMYDAFSWLDDRNRMDFTKQAAKAFANQLLTEGSDTRIALVVYGEMIHSYTGFYTAETKADLITAIEAISQNEAYGGTNQQAGIHKAQELLSSADSTGELKNIVILSDGNPTFSYPFVGGSGTTDCKKGSVLSYPYHNRTGTPTVTWPTVAVPNYDEAIGSGGGFSLSSGNIVWDLTCNDHNTTFEDVLYGSFYYDADGNFVCSNGAKSSNNGVATIWEANQAKAEGTTVYSVALQADTDGEATLKSCATDSAKGYFAISKNETDLEGTLTSAFTAIAGSIAIAASQGVVSDPMSKYVTFTPAGDKLNDTKDEDEFATGNYDVYISQGSVSWDEATATFTWETGNINEGVPAIMKYRVKLKDDAGIEKGKEYPTNDRTTFSYKNYQGLDTESDFNVPTVSPDGGIIRMYFYRVNADGQPVNSAGRVVEAPKFALLQNDSENFADENGNTGLSYNTQYTVNPKPFDGKSYYGYSLSGEAGAAVTKANSVGITLTPANAIQEVWFAYCEGFQIVHVQDGEAGLPETYAVEENFNITEKVSREYLYGGTFSDEDCQSVWDWDYENENPTDFTPEAGETYYIWEVSQTYLMPKLYRAYAHPTAYNGAEYVTQLHLLTTVDRDAYTEVGFLANIDTEEPKLSTTVEVNKNGELYETLYVAKNGSLGSKKAANVNEIVSGTGCVVTYSLTSEQFAAFEGTSGTPVTYEPYWITLDGVKVTNTKRTATHQGAGYNVVGTVDASDLSAEYVLGGTEPEALAVMAVYTLDYDAAPAAPVVPDEPVQPATVTITVHDGDTYKIADEPGAFDVAPKGAEGKLFAGWYADEAFTEVADLTDVQEDADIYAKYVSDNYLQVKYNNLGLLGRGSLRLVSAVDSKAYAETGFVVNGEKLVVSSYTTRYNLQNGKTLFGVGRNDPLMVASYSYKNLRRGDTIEIRAYWITPDGTTVYGDVRTLTYGRFGLEG